VAPNVRWSIDFMHAGLCHGRVYRLLNVVDDFTGESLAIEPAFSLGSADVIRVLEGIAFERGLPKTLRSDMRAEIFVG
jgi:putative transposase